MIIGADLAHMDDFTLSILTNPEVLKVNQDSHGNRQLWAKDPLYAWRADANEPLQV